MTDNDIIKALECCIEGDCDNCPWDEQTACNEYMKQDALDLINRQKANVEGLTNAVKYLNEQLSSAKAEAVKEFAERLKEKALTTIRSGQYITQLGVVDCYDIDNLVKEMVGEG